MIFGALSQELSLLEVHLHSSLFFIVAIINMDVEVKAREHVRG